MPYSTPYFIIDARLQWCGCISLGWSTVASHILILSFHQFVVLHTLAFSIHAHPQLQRDALTVKVYMAIGEDCVDF